MVQIFVSRLCFWYFLDVRFEEEEEESKEEKEKEADVEEEDDDDKAGNGVKKTSKRGLSKFLNKIFRHSAVPDNSLIKQAPDHRPHSSITKQATDNLWKQMWIRKKPDEDGYFLLQLGKQIDHNNMFLTALDASSLTIARKYLVITTILMTKNELYTSLVIQLGDWS